MLLKNSPKLCINDVLIVFLSVAIPKANGDNNNPNKVHEYEPITNIFADVFWAVDEGTLNIVPDAITNKIPTTTTANLYF